MASHRILSLVLLCVCAYGLDTKALLDSVRKAPTPAAALALLTAALPQAETPTELATVHYALGRHYQAQGNHAQAVAWFQKTHNPDPFQNAIVLNNLAISESALGDNVEAKAHLERALKIRREIKDGPGIAYSLLGLANVQQAMGDLAAAHQSYETVAAQWRTLGNDDGEAHAINNGGLILASLGEPARAAEAHRKALGLFKDPRYQAYALNNLGMVEPDARQAEECFRKAIPLLPTPREKAYAQQNLADLLLHASKFEEAKALYSTSLAAKLAAQDKSGEAYTRERLADYYLRRRELAPAAVEAKQSIALFRDIGDRAGEGAALALMAAIEWASGQRDLKTIAQARAIVEETRKRVANPELRSTYFSTKRSVYDFEISKLLTLKRPEEALALSERARARVLLDQRLQTFVAEPRSLVSADVTLLEYWLGEDEGAAFVVTPSGTRAYALPGRRQLEPQIEKFLTALTARNSFPPNETQPSRASRLATADAAWKSQLPAMQKLVPVSAKRLLLSPEGPLAKLPWALLTPAEVTLAPSLAVVAAVRARPVQTNPQVTVITDPSLRFAAQERAAIAKHIAVTDGPMESAGLLHFATHTTIRNLSPADVYTKKLKADLAVLSACRSAGGREIIGEGAWGLAHGLLYAGARRVIATLWDVDDQASARLMEHFYTELLQRKKPAPAALHAAQKLLAAEPRWSHPLYWAGYTLQGDWR